MQISSISAAILFPAVLPVCLWVMYTDLSRMKITNRAVLVLILIFLGLGPLVFPFAELPWRVGQGLVALALCFALFSMGAMGAGDAKFIAAAAPFVHPGDIRLVIAVFAAALLAAFATHRLIRHSPLRRLAPDWQSWQSGARFPLGFALGGTLAAYLLLGAKFGG